MSQAWPDPCVGSEVVDGWIVAGFKQFITDALNQILLLAF
jgi:hypothetical protein